MENSNAWCKMQNVSQKPISKRMVANGEMLFAQMELSNIISKPAEPQLLVTCKGEPAGRLMCLDRLVGN